jgi:hypothetical protein
MDHQLVHARSAFGQLVHEDAGKHDLRPGRHGDEPGGPEQRLECERAVERPL